MPSNSPFVYLKVEDALYFHRLAMQAYGGDPGIRDHGLLESAIEAARQTFDGQPLYKTVGSVAAAYWAGIVLNHPFIDGNKRVGLFCASSCLEINGFTLAMSQQVVENLTLALAQGLVTRPHLAILVDASLAPLA